MSRRQRARECQREFERQVAEQRAERAKREAIRERGAFIIEADEYTLALIEQFGVTALRGQLAENDAAYRQEMRRWQQQHVRETLAEALKAARKRPAPSFRIVLYTEERQGWEARRVTYEPCLPGERVRPTSVRRRRALADLAKLGLAVEYVNPNESGDGA